MRRRCDRHYGLGPLFFDGEGAGAGGGAPAPGAPPAPPAGGEPPPAAPPAPGVPPIGDREGFIPRDRFDQVNSELKKLQDAEAERQRKDLEDKGEHQKLAEQEKAKREAAEQRALTIARRSAFIGAAAGKVADAEAAYKLAVADGLLNDLDVDDDGNAKDTKKPGAIVDEVVKRYEFLKPKSGDRSYGGDRSGANGGGEIDPTKMTSKEMLSVGYAQSSGRQRGT